MTYNSIAVVGGPWKGARTEAMTISKSIIASIGNPLSASKTITFLGGESIAMYRLEYPSLIKWASHLCHPVGFKVKSHVMASTNEVVRVRTLELFSHT